MRRVQSLRALLIFWPWRQLTGACLVCLVSLVVVGPKLALATQTRMQALQGAIHLVDVNSVFLNPAQLWNLNNQVVFESAKASGGAGGFFENPWSQGRGYHRFGFYLNAPATVVSSSAGFREAAAEAATEGSEGSGTIAAVAGAPTALGGGPLASSQIFSPPENPWQIFYASQTKSFAGGSSQLKWGLGLSYSATQKRSVKIKQELVALSGGFVEDNTSGFISVSLKDYAQGTYDGLASVNEGARYDGQAMAMGGTFVGEKFIYSLEYSSYRARAKNSSENFFDLVSNVASIKAIKTLKMEDNSFYFGGGYRISVQNNNTQVMSLETSEFPVFLGAEFEPNRWIVFRGSVSQDLVLGTRKKITASLRTLDTLEGNTTVTTGIGLKFGSSRLDGLLGAKGNGVMDSKNLLSQLSLVAFF